MIDDHDGQFDLIPVTEGVHSDLGWFEAICIRCDERSGNNAEPFTDDWVEMHTCTEFDIIQKARHYNSHPSGVEAIDICRHLTGDWFNAFKYVFRSDHKNGRQDIEKALYYAKDAIAHDIPVRAPSWTDAERILLLRIIDTEPDDRRLGFFISILNTDREGALSLIEDILESWPE